MVALPGDEAYKEMLLLPDMPAETTAEFELLEILYDPFPPEMLTIWLPPVTKERLFCPKVRPDEDELDEFMVTESVPQVLEVSHTVIVAPPSATPETVRRLPDKFVDTTLALELLDIL
jgi:hypothetical protein